MNVCSGRKHGWPDNWDRFWANACYMLWIWRNKEKFEDGFVRPHNQVERLRKMIEYYSVLEGIMKERCMGRVTTL